MPASPCRRAYDHRMRDLVCEERDPVVSENLSPGLTLPHVSNSSEARRRVSGRQSSLLPHCRRARLALDQFAANPLMESLGVIVLDEFPDQVAHMALTEDDELVQTLVLYGLRTTGRDRLDGTSMPATSRRSGSSQEQLVGHP